MLRTMTLVTCLFITGSAATHADDWKEVGRARYLVEPARSLAPEPILLQDPLGQFFHFDPVSGKYTKARAPSSLRAFAAVDEPADEDQESESPAPSKAWRDIREERPYR